MEDLLELFHELGERGRREGEQEAEKDQSSDPFPLPIHRRLVVQRSRVTESKKDDQDEQQKPSGVVEDGDEGHDSDGDEEDHSTLTPKEGINDVTSV